MKTVKLLAIWLQSKRWIGTSLVYLLSRFRTAYNQGFLKGNNTLGPQSGLELHNEHKHVK